MSEGYNSSPRKTEVMKTFAGRSSSLQEEDASPTASPGTIRKKNTFFGSLRYTKKKHKSIEILRSQELIAEENESGRFMDQKEGDAERIRLLKSVKEGRMSIEEAMQQAEELGVNQSPSYHEASTEETIFNFGIYKYTKNRASCSRRILQFDFQEKVLCTIQKGSRGRKFEFSQIRGYDSEDGVRFDIYFEDYHDYELDADTVEEKNKICTLLESIVQQNKGDEPDGVFEAPVFTDKRIIKEGQVEKKGHSAAFMMWPRRWLRVQGGELSYFKIGEEQQSALNIIKLGPGQADVKKSEHNGFIITTSKKEYSFRVIAKDPQSETAERDEWIEAITEGSQPLITTTQRKSRGSSIFQDPAFTNSIQEQEKYIKDVVKTLQRELEQLTSVLSVVNAPIQATIQVKKVKEVVSKMDTHVKTGLLSWTMRQMKNRSDSSTDLQGAPPIGTLSRQSSTKSTKSQGGSPITPIDEGYETIVVPPARPPKTPDLPRPPKTPDAQQYTYDSIPSRQPVAASIDNSAKCPLSVPTAPQQPPPRPPSDEPSTRKDRQVPPYETVNITTPSSYSPSGSPSKHQEPSAIYQQPTSNREAIDNRFEAYDNVNIKNVPVTPPSVPPYSSEVDAGSSHEIDAGGMGCQSLDAAVKERKELYTEEDQSGVILLRVTENQDSNEDVSTKEPPTPPLPPGGGPPPPPPPPGIGAPPPPPPIGGGGIMALDSALPAKKAAKPKTKLRPFFWNKVPLQMVTQSMWLGASDRTSQLNLDSLEEMFQMEEKEKEVAQAQAKPTTKMLLDPKKAHNLGIFLSGFKLSAKEIDDKLSLFREEEGALPIDHVIALKRFLPTPEEQEMYKNIKEEDMPGLLQEDKFMIKLCEIPDLDKRLDLLLVVMEFPSQFEELAPAVSSVLDACHKLYSSQRFQVVLEYVLAIGNYINGGTNRGGAYGFRLTTLPKMADIRSGKNKKNTLLKYLLTELQRCCPDALMFLDDLKAVPKAADASIKGLSAEVEVMRKDLQKIKKHSSDLFLKYKRTEAQDVKLVRDVDEFVVDYEEKLKDLSEKCKEMKYIYSKLLMRFGEAANTDSEELFTALSTFVNQVKKTLNEAESGPSDKKRIKLDILNNAIAARMARSQSQDQELASTSTNSEPTENGTPNDSLTDVVDSGPERRPSSNSVEDEEARSSVSELKPQTSPFRASSPKVIHKKLSVKHSHKESLTLRPTKQGYLDKLSGGKHKAPKWDNRYFELAEGGHLHYYKKAEGKVINTIYLRGCPVIFDEQDSTIIRIKTDDREWSLKAATIDEAKDWKESLDFYAKKTSVSM